MSEPDQPQEESTKGKMVGMTLDGWNQLQAHVNKNQQNTEMAVLCLLDVHFTLEDGHPVREKTRAALMAISKKDPDELREMIRKREAEKSEPKNL
jgi:hypothetical protein